jgi:hypothetical protein
MKLLTAATIATITAAASVMSTASTVSAGDPGVVNFGRCISGSQVQLRSSSAPGQTKIGPLTLVLDKGVENSGPHFISAMGCGGAGA